MNYEQKYKEALERASKLSVQNPFDTVGQMVEEKNGIFISSHLRICSLQRSRKNGLVT